MDFIPTSLLTTCSSVFSEIIANLANLSFTEGCFPSYFKTAQISPRHKKPGLDTDRPSNYRPIWNLNNISKLLERLFPSRIQHHVFTCSHFNPYQSAYRRNNSTETSLLLTADQIFNSIDHRDSTLLVSLDLSAAFNTIDHHILLDRLHSSFGICNTVHDWLSSYLGIRKQFVSLGHSRSITATYTTDVPQGSVLGPILFCLFVSPFAQIVTKCWVRHQQYADDTQLYISISRNNTSKLHDREDCLLSLFSWFFHNGMSLNPEKKRCRSLWPYQSAKSLSNTSNINVAGTSVALSDKVKLLGVTLDRHLTFNSHIVQVCCSTHFHTIALRHIRNVIFNDTAKSVVQAVVSSRLGYANSISFEAKHYKTSEITKYTGSSGNALQSLWQCNHSTSETSLATY